VQSEALTYTTQMASTILAALGLNPNDLKGVRKEGTQVAEQVALHGLITDLTNPSHRRSTSTDFDTGRHPVQPVSRQKTGEPPACHDNLTSPRRDTATNPRYAKGIGAGKPTSLPSWEPRTQRNQSYG
jgi:hypothetical protein